MAIERTILSNLALNEEYGRKIQPFVKKEYFADKVDQSVYEIINNYITKYNSFPTKEALVIDLENTKGLNEEQFKKATEFINGLSIENSKLDWLLDTTEKWCQERALFNAAMSAIEIMSPDSKSKISRGAIPEIFTTALAVSFDTHVGHDYIEGAEERFDFYHRIEERIPFDLEYFNKITNGGLKNKTLNIILGGIGAGKTLTMCHMAAANLLMGKNVLYITLEISEEEIARRIDANLLDVALDDIIDIPKEAYLKKSATIKAKTAGKLIVKEYPTAQASSAHFRHLIHELNIKKDFRPDIIYVDYINLCLSARVKYGQSVNSYTLIKSIAEELRGLAVECDVPIVSATQLTRSGYGDSDPDMTDTAESFGLPATADLFVVIIVSDELEQLGQIVVKQLKNRYRDDYLDKKFVLGRDKSKMRLFDVEEQAQNLSGQEDIGADDDKGKFREFK